MNSTDIVKYWQIYALMIGMTRRAIAELMARSPCKVPCGLFPQTLEKSPTTDVSLQQREEIVAFMGQLHTAATNAQREAKIVRIKETIKSANIITHLTGNPRAKIKKKPE